MLVLHHPSAPSLGLGVFKATPVTLDGKAEEGSGPIFILGTLDGDTGVFSAVATWSAETDVRPAIDLLYKKAAVTNSFFELEDGTEDEKKLAGVIFYLRALEEMGYEPVTHEGRGIPFDQRLSSTIAGFNSQEGLHFRRSMANKETWEIYTQLTPTHKRIGIYNIKTKEKIQLGIIDRNMELPSTLLAIAKQQAKEHNGQLKEETSTPTSALTEGRSKRPKKMEGSHTSSVEKKD